MADEDTNPAKLEDVEIVRLSQQTVRAASISVDAGITRIADGDGYTAADVRLLVTIVDVDGDRWPFSFRYDGGKTLLTAVDAACDEATRLRIEAAK